MVTQASRREQVRLHGMWNRQLSRMPCEASRRRKWQASAKEGENHMSRIPPELISMDNAMEDFLSESRQRNIAMMERRSDREFIAQVTGCKEFIRQRRHAGRGLWRRSWLWPSGCGSSGRCSIGNNTSSDVRHLRQAETGHKPLVACNLR